MNKRKICVITGGRAEYGLFFPILTKVKKSKKLQLQLIVSTMHLASEFGLTYKQIEQDGFKIDDKIENLLSPGSKSSVAKSTGLAIILLSDSLKRLKPDIVLLLGDRYETLAAATTALLMNIPIAHIHGGEITEGAVDEQIRHSITKMSYLHFTSTEIYRKRIIQMGEDSSLVFNSGAPGIDNIKNLELLTKKDLETKLNWKFGKKSALFTYHPVTLEQNTTYKSIEQILKILAQTELNILFTYANSDDIGKEINQKIEVFCQTDPIKYKVVKSLGQLKYLSAMKYIDFLVGNTSSGIIEAASFYKPVINIGDRQKGRLQSGNVINSDINSLECNIATALTVSFKNKCQSIKNIYGDGNSAQQIVKILETQKTSSKKIFIDVDT